MRQHGIGSNKNFLHNIKTIFKDYYYNFNLIKLLRGFILLRVYVQSPLLILVGFNIIELETVHPTTGYIILAMITYKFIIIPYNRKLSYVIKLSLSILILNLVLSVVLYLLIKLDVYIGLFLNPFMINFLLNYAIFEEETISLNKMLPFGGEPDNGSGGNGPPSGGGPSGGEPSEDLAALAKPKKKNQIKICRRITRS